jgi:hypothetical protein
MAKRTSCKPVELWSQLQLFAAATRERRQMSADKSHPDLPGWIGFPIRFGIDAPSAARDK